jgi:hypothetical protein
MNRHRLAGVSLLALLAASALLQGVAGHAQAASSPATTVLSEFESGTEWHVSAGSASLSIQSSTKYSGTGALKMAYDMTASGAAGIALNGTPSELPGLPRKISMDIYEDGSWNTIYYEMRDSTGEVLRYWLGNLSVVGWRTLTLDFDSAVPISGVSGNLDRVLDLPGTFSQFLIWRNGSAPAIGTVYLDHLTYTYDPAALTAGTPTFVPSIGQSTPLTLSLTDAGSFSLRLIDDAGLSRTYTGTSGGGTSWSTTWNGRDNSSRVMAGSVRALLSVTRGSKTQSVQWPYLAGLPARAAGANATQRGINSFLTEIDTRSRTTAAAEAAQMGAGYVGMAREEFEWRRVEPARGVYDWPKFDQAVELERAHGIAILGKLAYGSPWDNTAPLGTDPIAASFYPPSNIQDYVDYAVATVHRYKDRVHAWEIWNEENNAGSWEPAPDPARYTQLLKATYSAIKAEDPTATVVLGGLSTGTDIPFLQGIQANGGWSSFDVLAIHSFVAGPPDGSWFEKWITDAKSILGTYGNKPIWITEFGWSSYTGSGNGYIGTSLDEQQLYLERSYEIAARAGVQGIFWFELMNRGTNPADSSQNYGVLYADTTPKLSFYGLQCEDKALYAGTMPTCGSPTYPAGTYHALTPTRLLDTRNGTGLSGAFSSHVARAFQVTGGVVPANATAVTGNLTVTQQTAMGFLFVGPQPRQNPTSSTLNFPVGDDRANAVTVALGSGGVLYVTYAAPTLGPTAQVIFDVTGYFTPDATGATYHALKPARLLDSRYGTGGTSVFSSHVAQHFQVTGGAVPSNATAVTGNLTVTQQSSLGFLYVGPSQANSPTSSNLNFPVRDDRANAVTVALGPGGVLWVTYAAPTLGPTAQVIFDVTGYFTPDSSGAKYVPLSPARLLDTRNGTGGLPLFHSHSAQQFQVTSGGGVVPVSATAVTGNLTVTQQSAAGFLYVGPDPANNPTSSTLNFPTNDDRANSATVALSTSGTLAVTYAAPILGPTAQVIFDVTGYFTP